MRVQMVRFYLGHTVQGLKQNEDTLYIKLIPTALKTQLWDYSAELSTSTHFMPFNLCRYANGTHYNLTATQARGSDISWFSLEDVNLHCSQTEEN